MHTRRPVIVTPLLVLAALFAGADSRAQSAAELNGTGVEHYNAREWNSAVTLFQSALRLEPDNAVIRTNLSNAYQAHAGELVEQSDFKRAINTLKNAVQLDTLNPQPLIQLGAYYLHEGFVEDAVFRLEEAVELAPGDPDAHFLLGEAYYKDNDARSALEQWKWVKEVDPDREGLAERLRTASRERRVEADFDDRSTRHFRVTYTREAEAAVVRDVLSILEKAYRDVGHALGNTYPPTPIQVTLYTPQGFSESTQLDEHVGALYDGSKIRCPVMDAQGDRLSAEELKRRLYHEYVHVVVRHLGKDKVPWWLNEGLAETLSHDLSENDMRLLRLAREKDWYFPLADISQSQLETRDVETLNVAYRQSHATVTFLKRRFGTRHFSNLLNALADGKDPEAALRSSFRYTYRTLELAVAEFIENG